MKKYWRPANEVREHFLPFARPDYVEGMILGNDLDSLLSAAYLHQRFGWPVAGVYCGYDTLWHTGSAEDFQKKLLAGKLFAVDLDICHGTVPSLGHHIIQLDVAEELPGHTHTLNPNALAGRTVNRDFRWKYPLATIHLLLWLFDDDALARRAAPLVWLADSAFINAQHYSENVAGWVQYLLPLPAFEAVLPVLQTAAFERDLQEKLLNPLAQNTLCKPAPASNYRSKHLGINGFQAQFEHPGDPRIQDLLVRLHQVADWPLLPFPDRFDGFFRGKRFSTTVSEIRTGRPFDAWLEQHDVFSYAFVFRDRINYTVLEWPTGYR